jgi:23S rRNA pseudouridine2457 synthase
MTTQVILLNKPYGVICQFTPSGKHRTLKDVVPIAEVYPAGRLDTDSEGLVVLTGDGDLQHRITDPRHKLAKTYFVEVEGAPADAALAPLRKGIQLSDYRARPAEVALVVPPDWLWPRDPPVRFRQNIPTTWLKITIREGRNRQIRHMTAAAGFPTLRLIRHSVGPWTLAGIASGTWKIAESSILNDKTPDSTPLRPQIPHKKPSIRHSRPAKRQKT